MSFMPEFTADALPVTCPAFHRRAEHAFRIIPGFSTEKSTFFEKFS